MLIPNLSKKTWIENPVVRIEERFFRHFLEFLAEPLAQRNSEALLAAVKNFVREHRRHGFLKNVFTGAAIQLERRGNARDFFHQLVIEERSANLDRKSTRLNSSHVSISYAVFCLK